MINLLYYGFPAVILGVVSAALAYLLHGPTWAMYGGLVGVFAGVLIVVVPEVVWRE